MSLVGDCILAARAAAPDPPSTLNAPSITSAAPAITAGGSLVLNQAFYIVATAINQWGETTGSVESNQVIVTAGNNSITGQVALPPGATGGWAYYTLDQGVAGSEQQRAAISSAGTFAILSATGGQPGAPPFLNSCWNPDSDGGFVSVGLMYKWLNDGLTFIAGAAGGIEDTTGLATIAQQLYYQIPGRWIRFNTARYDQWPVAMGDRDYIQYRYNVNGVVSLIAGEVFGSILGTIFSAFPEPGITSATTTLSSGMAAADTFLSCVDASAFRPMGRIQIDNELMMFSQVNKPGQAGSITGLIRGVGGTTPATHAIGALVQELTFNFSGFRYSQLYTPGQAALTLDCKHGWEIALNWYLVARYKEKEQSMQESDALDAKFQAYCKELQKDQANPIRVSQIGGTLQRGRDVGRGRIVVN